MGRAALEILSDEELWREMSTRAARDARKRFSRDAIVAQYEALYQSTLVQR